MSSRRDGGSSQLFVGRLSKSTRQRDIEDIFSRYGPLARCDVKYGTGMAYAFLDFEDKRDAEDAIQGENNRDMDGQRIVVEWARGPKRASYSDNECYNCGKPGHFARDCRSGGGDRGSRFGGGRGGGRGGGFRRDNGGYSRDRYSRSRSRERRRSDSWDRRRSRDSPERRSQSPAKKQERSRGRDRYRSRSGSPDQNGHKDA